MDHAAPRPGTAYYLPFRAAGIFNEIGDPLCVVQPRPVIGTRAAFGVTLQIRHTKLMLGCGERISSGRSLVSDVQAGINLCKIINAREPGLAVFLKRTRLTEGKRHPFLDPEPPAFNPLLRIDN